MSDQLRQLRAELAGGIELGPAPAAYRPAADYWTGAAAMRDVVIGKIDAMLASDPEPTPHTPSDAEIDAAGEAMYGDNWEQVKRFGWHVEQLQRALVAVDQVRRKG
jgi:hypothetical protein